MLKSAKRKRCKDCKALFSPFLSTQVACSPECALRLAKAAPEASRIKHERRSLAERKKAIKTLADLYGEAQIAVNKYVRARDRAAGYGCISCDKPSFDDAGHLFPIGSKYRLNPIRLNPLLINGQCRRCNSYVGGGNRLAYEQGIIKRYGENHLAMMYEEKRKADHGELLEYDRNVLIIIKKEFNKAALEMIK